MVETDIIVLAGLFVLLLHAFNSMLPQRRPEEFPSDNVDERPVSTV